MMKFGNCFFEKQLNNLSLNPHKQIICISIYFQSSNYQHWRVLGTLQTIDISCVYYIMSCQMYNDTFLRFTWKPYWLTQFNKSYVNHYEILISTIQTDVFTLYNTSSFTIFNNSFTILIYRCSYMEIFLEYVRTFSEFSGNPMIDFLLHFYKHIFGDFRTLVF